MVTETCAVCKAAASQKCGGCQSVYYCSKQHQRADWATHKDNCKPYKVCDNDVLGRHLVATRNMKTGEIVIKESPLLWGPSQVTGPVCLGCLKGISEEDSEPCASCGWPLCLNPACKHAAQHKPECRWAVEKRKALVRISQFITPHPSYECITALRMLYLRDNNKPLWEKLNRLQSHCTERRDTYKYEKDKSIIAQFLTRFYKLEGYFTEEEILRICGIIQINGHEVPTTDPAHVAIYDVASMLEHSCVPNCTKSFTKSGQLVIRTAGPVSRGDHLSICYTDALWGTPSRRHHLLETKFFSCCCSRCSDPTEMGTYFSALLCQSCGCESPVLPESFCQAIDEQVWKCQNCGQTTDNADVGCLLDTAGRDLASLSSKDIDESKQFLKRWKSHLHKNHYYLTEAKLALVQRYGQVHPQVFQTMPDFDFQYKMDLCRELITLITKLNPAEFRAIGMLYFELHAAVAEHTRRLQGADVDTVMNHLLEARRCLEECISYLQYEPSVLPEGIIAEQARNNLRQLNMTLANFTNVSP